MNISWVSSYKRAEVNEKHFNNKLTSEEMDALVIKLIRNHSHIGNSDVKKDGRDNAIVLFSTIPGIPKPTFCLVLCKDAMRRGDAKVVTMYDVRNPEHKAKRFGLKERKNA